MGRASCKTCKAFKDVLTGFIYVYGYLYRYHIKTALKAFKMIFSAILYHSSPPDVCKQAAAPGMNTSSYFDRKAVFYGCMGIYSPAPVAGLYGRFKRSNRRLPKI